MVSLMLAEGSFSGRVAIVTGGGAGIGEAIAIELARLGAAAVILGRRQDKLDVVCEAITAAGGIAKGYSVDVRDRAGIENVVGAVVGKFGKVDHQVSVVEEELSPSEDQLRWAASVIELASAGGVVVLDGQMIDKPVLERARRLLRLHAGGAR